MANIAVSALVKSLMRDRKPTLHVPSQVTRSQWTGKSKVLLLPGTDWWTFKLAFREAYTEAEARALRSFCAQLRGNANSFDMPILPNDQFNVAKSTTLNGALAANAQSMTVAAGGATDTLDGMYGSITTSSGNKRLIIVTGSPVGNVVAFQPAMNDTAANGAAVEWSSPVSRVRNADPDWEYDEAMAYAGFTLLLEESV